jgi:hypothetical protein
MIGCEFELLVSILFSNHFTFALAVQDKSTWVPNPSKRIAALSEEGMTSKNVV